MSDAPLRVLLFRHTASKDLQPYEDEIARALQGGKEPRGYLATGDDLGVDLRIFGSAPAAEQPPREFLDQLCHALVVVLVDRELIGHGDDLLWGWLAECYAHVKDSKKRHAVLPLAAGEETARDFLAKRVEFGELQVGLLPGFGEEAIRPAMVALRVLHECRVLLARAVRGVLLTPPDDGQASEPGYLRLFISHAKADGLPLAQALRYQIKSTGWLRSYYDADDLPVGSDWKAELERGVGSSLIIMLRTDIYDSRYWCQQEALWADEYAVPAVLVDARTGLNFGSGSLPFDRVPMVRIPDGNLLRILSVALREGLRFLLFARKVEELRKAALEQVDVRIFSYPPSMTALLSACRLLQASEKDERMILYPDEPPMRPGVYEAAHALVDAYGTRTKLRTPKMLAAQGEA